MRTMIIAALFGAMLALPSAGFAAGDAAKEGAATVAKIAVVDVQTLIGDSKAGKSIQAQISKQRESFKDELSSLDKDLVEMQKKLTESKAAKDSDEFKAKTKEFETKMINANELARERRQSLEKGAADAVLELRKEIVKVVADIADEEKFTIVISRQDVILAEKDMDITERVLAALDKKLPEVKVKMESAKAPAPAPKKK
ncbi:MAG: OmpH family outer membrane protein [Micavibrio sp.]